MQQLALPTNKHKSQQNPHTEATKHQHRHTHNGIHNDREPHNTREYTQPRMAEITTQTHNDQTRQSITPTSPEITTKTQYTPLSYFLTATNIPEIVAELHKTTPTQTYNRPTPTKEQNNITSKLNFYEDINIKNTPTTPNNHPQKNTSSHPRLNKTPFAAT